MEGDNIFRYRNVDIKLGGREMATVVYSNEEDDMCSLVIDLVVLRERLTN